MTGERGAQDETRAYYDEFSRNYEQHRRPNRADGYHALVDDLEVELCRRYAEGKEVLECGCGTGLILERIQGYAARFGLKAIDLDRRALQWAQLRGARSGRVAWQFIRDLAGELGKALPL